MQLERAGDHVGRAGAGVDVRALERGRREIRRCRRPSAIAASSASAGASAVDRIAREVRIGDVALHALDRQRARQRAAAAVLDHVAEPRHRRRLADDAVVDASRRARASRSTTLTVPSMDGPSSSEVISSAIEPARPRVRGEERLDRGDERRQRALHVGGAAAVQIAVAQRRARTDRIATRRAGRSERRRYGRRDTPAGARRPRRAHRLVTPLRYERLACESRAGRAARRCSAWQPASSGVSERRAISSRARASVGVAAVSIRAMVANGPTPRPREWRRARADRRRRRIIASSSGRASPG